ncbi:hypothetical protein SJ05684_c27450 [Sinorhizobium sojae CCBAU 05684]|uniref:Uncharacterized protein n=1 Tax=Sinorhizobium sojae CCBAU 05684 TaxID=716928 RepID=A0A249PEC6_9HYPH|nr:hypothetical protein SJ05684_c27450 [Sinorhizobium sojae CCBAU 05684]
MLSSQIESPSLGRGVPPSQIFRDREEVKRLASRLRKFMALRANH